MSNYLKFKEIMSGLNKDNYGTFRPNIVLSYKHEDSGFGNLFNGYRPLFELELEDLRDILWKYKYMEEESKIKVLNELKEDSVYYYELGNEISQKLDQVEIEIDKIKNL